MENKNNLPSENFINVNKTTSQKIIDLTVIVILSVIIYTVAKIDIPMAFVCLFASLTNYNISLFELKLNKK